MKKVELLSPVGNIESLKYAVMNGADAVYLGGKMYGARSYANNFTTEELTSAVKYCHLYNVKIYITVNTIIFDNEIDEFMKYIDFLYKINVDALIMQDIGMIKLVREKYPDITIHASTQMHNHNFYGIKLLEDLGVSRVVFARELSISEIEKTNCNIEKEVFIHGALCVCYSGCCLFSSMNTNRSGNRGECVASCRLPYKLLKNGKIEKTNGKYLLSTKELNTINEISKLLDIGIDSLKIEGRMKSPEYVGFITKIYREAIDNYYQNKEYEISNENLTKMKLLYNREYTKGYLFNDSYKDLMNIMSPNHLGINIGKVIYYDNKKIKIKLDYDLNQEDGIRFLSEDKGMIINKLYNEKGLLVNRINKGEIAIIDNKVGLYSKSVVNKTIDSNLMKELKELTNRRVSINMYLYAHKDEKLKLKLEDDIGNSIDIETDIVQRAINSPMNKELIEKQLKKLGNTPFEINKLIIDSDSDIFVSNKSLNEIRREACLLLQEKRENINLHKKNKLLDISEKKVSLTKNNINVLVRNESQLKACIDSKVDNIYITDYNLYKKYKNDNVYYVLPRVIREYKEYSNENLLVRELGSIEKYSKNNNVIGDYTLNVSNNESVKLLSNIGLKRICISPEVDLNNYNKISYNTEYFVYGRIELMITKYCMLNMLYNNSKMPCSLCLKDDKYSIVDITGKEYPIMFNPHNMIIYDSKNINYINELDKVFSKVNNIRIDLFDEDYNNTIEIINNIRGNYV